LYVPQGRNFTMSPLLYVQQSVRTCQTGVSSVYLQVTPIQRTP